MNKNQLKILNYTYYLLTRRRYSIREIIKKIDNYNTKYTNLCNDQELEEILISLKSANLINDSDYAYFFIDSQISKKPIGTLKLKQKLYQKGIDDEIIQANLNKFSLNEYELAEKLLNKKIKNISIHQLSTDKVKVKIIKYLINNGFPVSIAIKVFNQKLQELSL